MPTSSDSSCNKNPGDTPSKKCRFPEVPAVIHNIPNKNGSGDEDVEQDIDRLAQEIMNLGANYNIPRHRSLSGSEYEVLNRSESFCKDDGIRPRSASRGSSCRGDFDFLTGTRTSSKSSLNKIDFENLAVIPRSASFSAQEQDLDTFSEGLANPGWIDKRPLTCR